MKVGPLAVCIVILSAFVTGCGQAENHELVGRWVKKWDKGLETSDGGLLLKYRLDLTSDGNFFLRLDIKSSDGRTPSLSAFGQYKMLKNGAVEFKSDEGARRVKLSLSKGALIMDAHPVSLGSLAWSTTDDGSLTERDKVIRELLIEIERTLGSPIVLPKTSLPPDPGDMS